MRKPCMHWIHKLLYTWHARTLQGLLAGACLWSGGHRHAKPFSKQFSLPDIPSLFFSAGLASCLSILPPLGPVPWLPSSAPWPRGSKNPMGGQWPLTSWKHFLAVRAKRTWRGDDSAPGVELLTLPVVFLFSSLTFIKLLLYARLTTVMHSTPALCSRTGMPNS